MLFFIFLIVAVIATVFAVISDKLLAWRLLYVFALISAIAWIITIVMGVFIVVNHTGVNASVAENQQKYESLIYQAENSLYDNDNDFGKKELMNEIREWNEDLAFYKEAQRDFWIGVFYPNVFDEFEFISYDIIT